MTVYILMQYDCWTEDVSVKDVFSNFDEAARIRDELNVRDHDAYYDIDEWTVRDS